MHEIYGEQVNFVGVAGRDELAAINEFIDTLNVSDFEHAVDDDGLQERLDALVAG